MSNGRIIGPRKGGFFVPEKFVSDDLHRAYIFDVFDEQICSKCETKQKGWRKNDRDPCLSCAGLNHIDTTRRITVTNRKTGKPEQWVRFAGGHPDRFCRVSGFSLDQFVDLRSRPAMTHALSFTSQLYDGSPDAEGRPRADQVQIVKDWMVKKSGIIRAKPRSGKTVVAANIICSLRTKTLVLAAQQDHLRQMRNVFYGNADRGIPPMTNAAKFSMVDHKKCEIPVVHLVEDFDAFIKTVETGDYPDVVLMTYQTLLPTHGDRVGLVQNLFGLIVVDECHNAAADGFYSILDRFNTTHWLGLTATVERTDKRYYISANILGPVVATSKTMSLCPNIQLIETGISFGHMTWNGFIGACAGSDKRNRIIIKHTFDLLAEGHECVLIPVQRTDHGKELQQRFDTEARTRGYRDPTFSYYIHGSGDRSTIFNRIENREFKVILATQRIIREGTDLKVPSALIYTTLTRGTKDEGAPTFQQLCTRVCTPAPGKKKPVVTLLLDNSGPALGCFRGMVFNEILPLSEGDEKTYDVSRSMCSVLAQVGDWIHEKVYRPPTVPVLFKEGHESGILIFPSRRPRQEKK